MAFKIIEGSPKTAWFPVGTYGPGAFTVYLGSIVKFAYNGVECMGAAAAGPSTIEPFGIVVGTDAYPGNATYSSTTNTEYIASVITQATIAARNPAFHGGMAPVGDKRVYVKVALITPETILEGPIRNAAIGTAPTVVTCTTASSDGLTSMVHGAACFTPVANNSMYYCRSGANMGLYNQNYAASTTTPTFYSPWPEDWAVGDTFVAVNIGLGRQRIDFNATNNWVECSSGLSNYWPVDVSHMDLSVAGAEKLQFKFAWVS